MTLPSAVRGSAINRSLYFFEGSSVTVAGQSFSSHKHLAVNAAVNITLSTSSENTSPSEVLILQGRPIGDPVVKHGPFVMNTQAEIQQTISDYRRTLFGGWPWPRDDYVFPATKGRFALIGGEEIYPPSSNP